MRLFLMYNLQLEIINFLYKNLRKAKCCLQVSISPTDILNNFKIS